MSLLFLHTTAIKSPLVLTRMSPHFNLSVLGLRSLGMPFLCSLTVTQQEIFYWAKSSNRSGVEKKLSMYSLWPNPFTTLLRLVTVAWVAVRCCACLYQGKQTFMSYVYPVASHSLSILILKCLRFFWDALFENYLSLVFHNDFICCQMFGRVVRL